MTLTLNFYLNKNKELINYKEEISIELTEFNYIKGILNKNIKTENIKTENIKTENIKRVSFNENIQYRQYLPIKPYLPNKLYTQNSMTGRIFL